MLRRKTTKRHKALERTPSDPPQADEAAVRVTTIDAKLSAEAARAPSRHEAATAPREDDSTSGTDEHGDINTDLVSIIDLIELERIVREGSGGEALSDVAELSGHLEAIDLGAVDLDATTLLMNDEEELFRSTPLERGASIEAAKELAELVASMNAHSAELATGGADRGSLEAETLETLGVEAVDLAGLHDSLYGHEGEIDATANDEPPAGRLQCDGGGSKAASAPGGALHHQRAAGIFQQMAFTRVPERPTRPVFATTTENVYAAAPPDEMGAVYTHHSLGRSTMPPRPSPRPAEHQASGGDKTDAPAARNARGRKEWAADEDAFILSQVEAEGTKWRLIAAKLPGRSDDAVRNRWKRLSSEQHTATGVVAGGTSADLVKTGDRVADALGCFDVGPSGDCEQQHLAKPKATTPRERLAWSRMEDAEIVNGVQAHGLKWGLISQSLPGRTAHAIRNRFHRLQMLQAEQAAAAGNLLRPPSQVARAARA